MISAVTIPFVRDFTIDPHSSILFVLDFQYIFVDCFQSLRLRILVVNLLNKSMTVSRKKISRRASEGSDPLVNTFLAILPISL